MKQEQSETQRTADEIIKKRRNAVLDRRGWLDLITRLAVIVFAFYILFSKIFIVCQLDGNGMFPSLKDGDLVLGYRLQQDIQKDDLILYEMDHKICASRVVAKGTDYVDMDEEGRLYVNGTVQSGEILYPTMPKELLTYPYQVPKGYVFVLGDYRTQSSDSRDFGPLPEEAIKGKVITIVRRRGF